MKLMNRYSILCIIVGPSFRNITIRKLLLWHILVLIDDQILVIALKHNSTFVKNRLDSVIFGFIHEFLTQVGISRTTPLSNIDIINLPSVRFVMLVHIESNFGAFAPAAV